MQKIVAPLGKAGKDVFYDGSRALVENETNTLSAVVVLIQEAMLQGQLKDL